MTLWFALLLAASPVKGARPDGGVAPSASRPSRAADGGSTLAAAAIKNPISVDASQLKLELKNRRGIYTGHVRVRRGTMRITCDRLVAHYTEAMEIERVECDGNVEMIDGDRWARGEHGDFDNVKGVIELSGNPQARQGTNEVRGGRIAFDLVNDVVEVKEKVQTTFESSGTGLPLPKSSPAPKAGGR